MSDPIEALVAVPPGPERDQAVLAALAEAIRRIRYGSVLVKIHDGKVVGIETSTKVKLSP
jgi:hypothetical protein